VAGLGGVDSPAVQAAGSMRDWNQARDGPTGAHTDIGGQCADGTEASVDADGPARTLHTGMRSRSLGQVKSGIRMPT